MSLTRLIVVPQEVNGIDNIIELNPYPGFSVMNKCDIDFDFDVNGVGIGLGSSAVVFRGRFNGIPVAVKVFRDLQDKEGKIKFPGLAFLNNEVNVIAKLHHKYIVKSFVYTFEPPSVVSELMKDDLRGVMFTEHISWYKRIKIASQIASALNYLHKQGYIHGDVKSENILLDENYEAKLADFDRTSEASGRDRLSGTLGWIAPEVVSEKALLDIGINIAHPDVIQGIESDMFSFGIVLLELVMGARQFKENYLDLLPQTMTLSFANDMMCLLKAKLIKLRNLTDCPRQLVNLIENCLQECASKRPTAKEVKTALKLLLTRKEFPLTNTYCHLNGIGFFTEPFKIRQEPQPCKGMLNSLL